MTKMSFTAGLGLLDSKQYPGGIAVARRWGEVLREDATIRRELERLRAAERVVTLGEVAEMRGGVVTRANAFFLVRDLPFDQVPKRFHLTTRDYDRVAVVMDGMETAHRIERSYLRPTVKGPEGLAGPWEVEETHVRLFHVVPSQEELRRLTHTGATDYLKRGEKVSYNMSGDSLKGGIPAERSQIKNRKPYWYSLTVHDNECPQIVVPEHVDTRYVAMLLLAGDTHVVIDKLYLIRPTNARDAEWMLRSLWSTLTWYQIELRGRTQLGQGVLELKKSDWRGILIANPASARGTTRKDLGKLFDAMMRVSPSDSLTELGTPERHAFDVAYLAACGVGDPEALVVHLERQLRGLASERSERRDSVVDAKIVRRRQTSVSAWLTLTPRGSHLNLSRSLIPERA